MIGRDPAKMLRALQEQNTILGIRGEATVGSAMDGLDYLLAKYHTGDAAARQGLRHFRELLHILEELPLSVDLPSDPPPGVLS